MGSRVSRALLASAILLLASCSSDRSTPDAPDGTPSTRAASSAAIPPELAVRAFVAHRDTRNATRVAGARQPPGAYAGARQPPGAYAGARQPPGAYAGAPSFVWLAKEEGVRFATATEAGTTTLKSIRSTFGLDDAAFAAVSLTREGVDDAKGGPIVVRYQQRDEAHGLDVFRGGLNVALTRSFDPVSASGSLVRTLAGADRPFSRNATDALNDAFTLLGLPTPTLTSHGIDDGAYERFTGLGLRAPARVKKVLFPAGEGVTPAYYVELQIVRGPSRSFVVSAVDGHVLFTNDLVRNDAFSYRVYADPTTKVPTDGPMGNIDEPYPASQPIGLKPKFNPMSLVTLQNYPFSMNDPWLPAGATTSAGNNVSAYADRNPPDGVGGDAYLGTNGPSLFDYPYDTLVSPGATATNIGGSVTHLFYVTNFLHDWYYDLGFDEKAGNHQLDNYGRGGQQGDPLLAEAQDYSGTDNSNASTPPDGMSPRIQMYVFSGSSVGTLTVQTPPSLAGEKAAAVATFGSASFDLTGTVALAVDDQGPDPSDGCETVTANLTGKIALVHRGTCAFTQKVQNAQNAGAIGCIVANVATSADPTTPPEVAGTTTAITIPVLGVAFADGQALEAGIALGETVRMGRPPAVDLDGALDSSVVSHEWGHVISNRLIGNANGLTTNQSGGLGEGWGDTSALYVMIREGDAQTPNGANWNGAYPIGEYATSSGAVDVYFGFRRVPYSTNFAIDPLTFKHIANGNALPTTAPIAFGEDGSFNSEVHSTGEIWATMMLECYAALLRDPRYTFVEAQTRMRRYFVASLKLTPIDPTLLEARDAVLAAALATDPTDYKLFWQAFARRGAGVGALGPAKDSTTNDGVVESYSSDNDVEITGGTVTDDVISCDHDGLLDDGEVGTFSFTVRNDGPGPLSGPVATVTSSTTGVSFPDGQVVKLDPLQPFGKAAKASVHVMLSGVSKATTLTLSVTVSDSSFASGHTQTLTVSNRAEADESDGSSAIDHVDTTGTSWVATSTDTTNTATPWSRVTTGLDGYWSVPDSMVIADEILTSAPFTLTGTTFELDFKHRYSFRFSTRRMVDVDGGVVEVSVDNGKTWVDASQFGTIDYNTKLDNSGIFANPLAGRAAYGNVSAGYPDAWITSKLMLDLKTHPDSVRIRFHTGSAQGFAGYPGWDVDDIALVGVSSTPFWSFVDHADACDPMAPVAQAGPPQTVIAGRQFTLHGSGSSPGGFAVRFAWAQLDGPSALPFPQDGSASADYIAPSATVATPLTFELRANDGTLVSPASQVVVTVVPQSTDSGGCSASSRSPSRSAGGSAAAAAAALFLALGIFVRRRARS